ncbi:hypothetical protein WH47_07367 [Habropoda laboriosa]|uniref:Uncharacterized protein n=1 Tax=Habropoda laboriosa TaxID=597456 RepID=A0A0L7R623_9HYME|nr:hypothetical protein WH47_07367 [Habropoda laboriosa]
MQERRTTTYTHTYIRRRRSTVHFHIEHHRLKSTWGNCTSKSMKFRVRVRVTRAKSANGRRIGGG